MTRAQFFVRLALLLAIIAVLALAGARMYRLLLELLGVIRHEGNLERDVRYEDSIEQTVCLPEVDAW